MPHYPIYLLLLIPVISATIGYVTNVVAVKMMFYPARFVGIRPYLGWQGIVPANALRLSATALEMVTAELLKISALFTGIDPASFLQDSRESLQATTRRVVEEQASTRFSALWSTQEQPVKEQAFAYAFGEVQAAGVRVVAKIIEQIEDVLDVRGIVTKVVRARPTIVSRVFLELGAAEFRFIERSGAGFGLLFGLVQLGIWVIYPAWWILPFFGFVVGYATNWVAIRLVFDPKEPLRIAGFTFQGLFHKHQREISLRFGALVSDLIFSDENIFHELTAEGAKKKIMEIVSGEVEETIARLRAHPMAQGLTAAGMLSDELVDSVRGEIEREIEAELVKPDGILAAIARRSDQIRAVLQEGMTKMDPVSFEAVLRPIFKQDEWKLIIAGALLGLGAGTLQLIYLFGESLR